MNAFWRLNDVVLRNPHWGTLSNRVFDEEIGFMRFMWISFIPTNANKSCFNYPFTMDSINFRWSKPISKALKAQQLRKLSFWKLQLDYMEKSFNTWRNATYYHDCNEISAKSPLNGREKISMVNLGIPLLENKSKALAAFSPSMLEWLILFAGRFSKNEIWDRNEV